jgi:hypothetical protein
MWGQSKPVVLSYGRQRSAWALPPWLVLLLLGAAAGAAGVVYVQEKHLPPRLSASASAELRSAYEQAEAQRQRLATDMAEVTKRLDAALMESRRLGDELAATRSSTEKLRQDLEFTAEALPPDPRGGVIEVRAARLLRKGAALSYEVALTRAAGGKPMNAVLQLSIVGDGDGDGDGGAQARVVSKPVALAVGSHEVARGLQPLPDGFRPRQATILVLDRPEGRQLGMRVMFVK